MAVSAGSTSTVNFNLQSGPAISYFYDEPGRLTGVVDPMLDSVRYSYDAVGNLLSVSRQGSSQVAILEFNPDRGFDGTTVAIYGTGFSATPGENTVQFNGTPATVSSSTTTQIITVVPAGATTGPITVTAPAGSATSSPFTIPSDVEASIVPGGAPVTVSIPTPRQNARVTIDGATPGQKVSLVMSASTIPEVDVSFLNPDGTTLAGPEFLPIRGLGYIDTQTLVSGGSYKILLDPRANATGSLALKLHSIVDATATTSPGGAPVTVSTTLPGQNARVTFNGVAGRKISLVISSVTIGESDVSVIHPDGTNLVPSAFMGITGLFIDATTLPADGSYTILIDPRGTYTGSAMVALYDVVDISSTITPGDPQATAYIGIPGQNATWTFTGAAGQRVSQIWEIETQGDFISGSVDVTLSDPVGSTLSSARVRTQSLDYSRSWGGLYIETVTLTSNGTYTISANPVGAFVGWVGVDLYNVPPDVTGTVTINDPAINVNLPIPGQNGYLNFEGAAGQQVTVHVTNNTICTNLGPTHPDSAVSVTLRRQDGATMTSSKGCGVPFDLPTQTLPVPGQYTIFVDPEREATGVVDVSVTSP